MNSPGILGDVQTLPLYGLALALLAPAELAPDGALEARWMYSWRERCQATGLGGNEIWNQWLGFPPDADANLHALAIELALNRTETLAVALAAAVELDPMVGRVLAWLQHPAGHARPTLGLVATLAAAMHDELGPGSAAVSHAAALMAGQARACGLLHVDAENTPLQEAALRVPVPLALALAGEASTWPGGESGLPEHLTLPASIHAQAARHALAFSAGHRALAIRSGHPREARAAARAVAKALHADAAYVPGEPAAGLGPWLWLTGCIPVFCTELGPGELRSLPKLPGYGGAVLVASGPDGVFEFDGEPVASWRIPVPGAEERIALWHDATQDAELAQTLGRRHRHHAGRIADLARAGQFHARLGGAGNLTAGDVAKAARSGAAADLGTLAELLPDPILDDAIVLPAVLRAELDLLASRCHARDELAAELGPAVQARYRPGVRALLYGPSGTGKTLAVAWLATRLGMPLYRVDLASVTSKYIGETEKNLAQLFARAEHAEVVLLFDEADALFGKRTDVKDSNDRFANAQTNYLLQRIESFEGIAILTSNSRARFDSAFARRLDAVIEFPAPGPEDRRALWLAHLGQGHALSVAELNRLAAACDLAGGHIRNVALAAAVAARLQNRAIAYGDIAAGVAAECRKLGKQPPPGLAVERSS